MDRYNKLYLVDAVKQLAHCFNYAVNYLHIDIEDFVNRFLNSKISKLFENGHPHYISGMSSIDLVHEILCSEIPISSEYDGMNITEEYWCGWILAQYHFYSGYSYQTIFNNVSILIIKNMYHPYHEMDITSFFERMDELMKFSQNTNLKLMREKRKISQSALAKKSGVNIRNIQLYEQKVNDIDKAQVQIIIKLAKAL